MRLEVSTPAALQPASLAEVKAWGRITHDSEDDFITSLIKSATTRVEMICKRAFITQIFTMYLDKWPGRAIDIPRPPFQTLTSFSYWPDGGSAYTAVDSNIYTLDDSGEVPARIVLKEDNTWPEVEDRPAAVRLIYVAGYGDTSADVPQAIREGVQMLAAHLYETRGAIDPMFREGLLNHLAAYRLIGVAS